MKRTLALFLSLLVFMCTFEAVGVSLAAFAVSEAVTPIYADDAARNHPNVYFPDSAKKHEPKEVNPNWPQYDGLLYGYAMDEWRLEASWYTIDPSNGAAALAFEDYSYCYATAFNPDDGYLYTYSDNGFCIMDLGGATVGSWDIDVDSVDSMTYDPATGFLFIFYYKNGSYAFGMYDPIELQFHADLYTITANDTLYTLEVCSDALGNLFAIDYLGNLYQIERLNYSLAYLGTLSLYNDTGITISDIHCDYETGRFYLSCWEWENGLGELFTFDMATLSYKRIGCCQGEFCSLYTIVGQDFEYPSPVLSEDVIISETEITMDLYDSHTLSATVSPSYASSRGITWLSGDESIVTVDNKGVLTSRAPGVAQITAIAADGNSYAFCDVTVVDNYEYPEYTENTVYAFVGGHELIAFNTVTGMQTAIRTFGDEATYYCAEFDPNSGLIYAYNSVLFTFDTLTLDGLLINQTKDTFAENGVHVSAMAYDPTSNAMLLVKGNSYMLGSKQLFKLDLRTGVQSFVSDLIMHPCAIGCDNYGNAWIMDYPQANQPADFYSLNKQTGEMTLMGNTEITLLFGQAMNYSNVNEQLYFFRQYSGLTYELYSVDTMSGGLTKVCDLPGAFYGAFELIPEGFVFNDLVVESIEIVPHELELPLGNTASLSTEITPSLLNPALEWTSSNEAVAQVNSTGVVSAVGYGTATITATSDGVSGACIITVTASVYPEYDSRPIAYTASDVFLKAKLGWSRIQYPAMPDEYAAVVDYELLVPKGENEVYAAEFNPDDGFIYGYTDNGYYFKMSVQGVVVAAVATANIAYDMAYSYTDRSMYAIANDAQGVRGLYTVELSTGEMTLVGDFGGRTLLTLAIDNYGVGYGVEYVTGDIYLIDINTGSVSGWLESPLGKATINGIQTMTVNPLTNELYWAAWPSACVYRIELDGRDSTFVNCFGSAGWSRANFTAITYTVPQGFTVEAAVPTTELTIDVHEIAANIGDSYMPNITVLPEDASSKCYFANSSDSAVVTVNPDGSLWFVGVGTATVTYRAAYGNGVEAITVTVGEYTRPEYDGTFYGTEIYSKQRVGMYSYDLYGNSSEFIRGTGRQELLGAAYNSNDGYIYRAVYESQPLFECPDSTILYTDTEKDALLVKASVSGVVLDEIPLSTTNLLYSLAYDVTTGTMYGISIKYSSYSLYSINLKTGEVSYVGDPIDGLGSNVLAIDGNGVGYGIEYGTDKLYAINLETCESTLIGSTGLPLRYTQALTFDINANTLYWAYVGANVNDMWGIHAVDTQTAETTLVYMRECEIVGLCTIYNSELPLLGDADENGVVDSLDALLVIRFYLGLVDESALNAAIVDVNDDGEITSIDALIILRWSM